MEEKTTATYFLPSETKIELGENEYTLVFDMLALAELEKIYGSVDVVINMIFGGAAKEVEDTVTYNDAAVNADEIKVAGVPLTTILMERRGEKRVTKHTDTLEIVWAGMLRDNAIYDAADRITGYKVSKRTVASLISLKNYARINLKIVEAFLKDLAPGVGAGDSKNELEAETPATPIQLIKTE